MSFLVGQKTRRIGLRAPLEHSYGKLNLKKMKDRGKRQKKLARLRLDLHETELRIRRGVSKTSAGFDLVAYAEALRSQIRSLL
jgi:hypothetical protein